MVVLVEVVGGNFTKQSLLLDGALEDLLGLGELAFEHERDPQQVVELKVEPELLAHFVQVLAQSGGTGEGRAFVELHPGVRQARQAVVLVDFLHFQQDLVGEVQAVYLYVSQELDRQTEVNGAYYSMFFESCNRQNRRFRSSER